MLLYFGNACSFPLNASQRLSLYSTHCSVGETTCLIGCTLLLFSTAVIFAIFPYFKLNIPPFVRRYESEFRPHLLLGLLEAFTTSPAPHPYNPFPLDKYCVSSASQEADCKKMVDTAVEKFGALHVAFNNAGIFRAGLFAGITEETIDSLLDTNVKSLAWCFKYQVPPHESLLTNENDQLEKLELRAVI